jgi:hypothetical protein
MVGERKKKEESLGNKKLRIRDNREIAEKRDRIVLCPYASFNEMEFIFILSLICQNMSLLFCQSIFASMLFWICNFSSSF